jgi:hypothetical protein
VLADPTKKLLKLLSEQKFEKASDECHQFHAHGFC